MIKLKELLNEIEEACWVKYKQVGTKLKDGETVPNCVKKEGFVDDDNIEEYDDEREQDIK